MSNVYTIPTVKVAKLPDCDFCGEQAKYDGRTLSSVWAYMCEYDFQVYGVGLGIGVGQRLMLQSECLDHESLADGRSI